MNAKILRYELLTYFFLTLVCSVVYIYGEQMPDNFLEITSADPSSNFITYYFSSFMQFIYYYSGLWVLFPFVAMLAMYVPVLAKRCDIIDLMSFFAISLASLSFSLMVMPNFVGLGLRQFALSYFSNWTFALGFIGGLFLSLWMLFRGDFIAKVKEASDAVKAFLAKNDSMNSFKEGLINLSKQLVEKINDGLAKKTASSPAIEESKKEEPAPSIKKIQKPEPTLVAEAHKAEAEESESNYLPVKFSDVSKEVTHVEITREVTKEIIKVDSVMDDSSDAEAPAAPRIQSHDEALYFSLVSGASEKRSEQRVIHPEDQYFEDILNTIESKLNDFQIEGRIINILKGPVVDTFELKLGPTMKVAKIISVSEDLSLALKGAPVRIVFPMKGRTTVGIEVPRHPREIIFLDEMLSSKEFAATEAALPIAMGKNAFGEPVVENLAAMPHMLVAGSTGAGKSVFINSLLVSLLVKKSPNQMKLILIDPKQLELALYAKLPHLCMPVITEPKTASISLLWACEEMERRYSILTEVGVRNIAGFNEKLKKATPEMKERLRKHYEYATEDTYELPYIVIIVDEFADLMLSSAGKDIEKNICRLAAKARAAGIHLVVATQRPSVDVITGVIKSNFPVRVSFRVTSQMDSRTILNEMGAEKLLGKGDMLYKHNVETTRVHSPYVDEEEIEVLAQKLAETMPAVFDPHAMEFIENGGEDPELLELAKNSNEGSQGGRDERYDEAVRVVIEHRQASASLLQRRLGVGYNRAANLIEEMEANGVVGPAQGSKPRKVLLGSESINP